MKRKSEHLNGTIKRRKVTTEDGTPKYELLHKGQVVAVAAMTGRSGVDNYPWGWRMVGDKDHRTGCEESLRVVVQTVEHALAAQDGGQ